MPFLSCPSRRGVSLTGHLEESLRADAGRKPGQSRCGSQRRRWFPQLPCRVGKAHPDSQRVRRPSSGTDGSGLPVNDRTGLKVRSLIGIAAAPDAQDVSGQAVDLLAKGGRYLGVRWRQGRIFHCGTALQLRPYRTRLGTTGGLSGALIPGPALSDWHPAAPHLGLVVGYPFAPVETKVTALTKGA